MRLWCTIVEFLLRYLYKQHHFSFFQNSAKSAQMPSHTHIKWLKVKILLKISIILQFVIIMCTHWDRSRADRHKQAYIRPQIHSNRYSQMQLLELSSSIEHLNPFCKHANTWQGAICCAVPHNEVLVMSRLWDDGQICISTSSTNTSHKQLQ